MCTRHDNERKETTSTKSIRTQSNTSSNKNSWRSYENNVTLMKKANNDDDTSTASYSSSEISLVEETSAMTISEDYHYEPQQLQYNEVIDDDEESLNDQSLYDHIVIIADERKRDMLFDTAELDIITYNEDEEDILSISSSDEEEEEDDDDEEEYDFFDDVDPSFDYEVPLRRTITTGDCSNGNNNKYHPDNFKNDERLREILLDSYYMKSIHKIAAKSGHHRTTTTPKKQLRRGRRRQYQQANTMTKPLQKQMQVE